MRGFLRPDLGGYNHPRLFLKTSSRASYGFTFLPKLPNHRRFPRARLLDSFLIRNAPKQLHPSSTHRAGPTPARRLHGEQIEADLNQDATHSPARIGRMYHPPAILNARLRGVHGFTFKPKLPKPPQSVRHALNLTHTDTARHAPDRAP
jgi:hypothetical protein